MQLRISRSKIIETKFLLLPRCNGLSRVLQTSGVSPFNPGFRDEFISQELNEKYIN